MEQSRVAGSACIHGQADVSTPLLLTTAMPSLCADILLFAAYRWPMSKPSLMAETNDVFDQKPSNKYWVDVQVSTHRAWGSCRCAVRHAMTGWAHQRCTPAVSLRQHNSIRPSLTTGGILCGDAHQPSLAVTLVVCCAPTPPLRSATHPRTLRLVCPAAALGRLRQPRH